MITAELEDVWPDVERRLRALLYRRGLDKPCVDDVVQEVALRVLSTGVTYDSAGDLLRWAAPVACRLHVDLLRHRARMTDPEEAVDRASRDDVAGEVADRLELQRALRAIAALRPADREAIIDGITSEPSVPRDRQEAVRLAVRRHRARSRLAIVLEQLAAWLTGWRLVTRHRRGPAVAALVPAAAAVPLLITLGPVSEPAPPRNPRPPAVGIVVNPPEAVDRAATVTVVRRPPTPVATTPPPTARTLPVRVRKPDPVPAPQVTEVGVGGENLGVTARKDPRRPEDRFLCINDLPTVQSVCVL